MLAVPLPPSKEPSQIYTEATSLGLERSRGFAMVKHMGKPLSMLPSPGKGTHIPPLEDVGKSPGIDHKGHGGYKAG